MEYISKLFTDIFAMKFDVVIPISGCIVAIVIAFIVFAVRYYGYQHKRKKFKDQTAEAPDFHSVEYLKNHPEFKSMQKTESDAPAQQGSADRKEPV